MAHGNPFIYKIHVGVSLTKNWKILRGLALLFLKLKHISFWYSLIRLQTGQEYSLEFIDYHEKCLAGIFKSLFCVELAYVVIGRPGFNPWVGRFPWRRAWQSTPVFLPGESPWTEEPGGLQPMGSQSRTLLK